MKSDLSADAYTQWQQPPAGSRINPITSDLNVESYAAEQRRIAKLMPFDQNLAPYINWDYIAQSARALGAHIDARYHQDGACTVTLWWEMTDNG